MKLYERDDAMSCNLNVIEEVASICKRFENKEISLLHAKTELLYMINAAITMDALKTAHKAYAQIGKNEVADPWILNEIAGQG